jgi:hypothetical protein
MKVSSFFVVIICFTLTLFVVTQPTFAQPLINSFDPGAAATPTPPASSSSPTSPSTPDANAICGVGETDINKFIAQFFSCGLGLIGGVSILFIIYGGFLLVLSTGDPRKVQEGREYITYAIVGIVLAVLAYVILQTIGASILHIPGFG